MKRKLDVGEVLSETFSIYRQHAGVLLPLAFWLFLIVAIAEGLSRGDFAFFPLVIVVSTLVATLYQGVVVSLVRDVHDGRAEASMGGLLKGAMPFVWRLIAAGLLSGIGIGVGLVALVVPGLILLTIWAVIAPVIVVEDSAALDAFGRSRELVGGNGWPVFGAIAIAFLITLFASLLFSAIAVAVAEGILVLIVFSALASMVTAPVMALLVSVIYYRLRAIERNAAMAAPAAPPA